jgi:hypothetical protein
LVFWTAFAGSNINHRSATPLSSAVKRGIMNMTGFIVVSLIVIAATGIVLISLIQTKIIREYGIRHFKKRGFINVYWHDRTITERWCFWTGLSLMITPFVVAGLYAIVSV